MEPYAKPNERKVGAQRPRISHLPSQIDTRTRKDRKAETEAVSAERRAIKKSAQTFETAIAQRAGRKMR